MDAIRANVRSRLHFPTKIQQDMPPTTEHLPQPQIPDRRDSKRRTKVKVRQLEAAESQTPPTKSTPASTERNSTQPTPLVKDPIIPFLPILHALSSSISSASPFLNLPPDIIHLITTHLPWNSLLALRSTCRPLSHLLNTTILTILRHNLTLSSLTSESLLLAAYRLTHPRSPEDHLWDLFYAAFEWQLLERPAKALACYGCLETKPLNAFVERMSSRGTGLGGRKASQRRCKECMRRGCSMAGVWWREHWVRKRDVRRRKGRGERVWGWLVHRQDQEGLRENVKPGEEVGVCCVCGTGQFELFWGCAGCFEKEEERRRRQEWELLGLGERGGGEEGADVEGWVRWVLERADNYRGRKEKRRRKRYARRAESGGKWWSVRRLLGWMAGSETWTGSWGERVEALVEYLHGPEYQLRRRRNAGAESADDEVFEGVDIRDGRATPDPTSNKGSGRGKHAQAEEGKSEWKATDQVPLKKDRRETRCCMCWVPTARPSYALGLAYEPRLRLARCCDDCQLEEAEKRRRRGRRGTAADGGGRTALVGSGDDSADEAWESIRDLF